MRATKLIVLIAGIVGAGSFFLPLVSIDPPPASLHASALELVEGVEVTRELEQARSLDPELARALDHYRMVLVAIYLPAVLLIVFGVIGLLTCFGRGLGFLTLLLSLLELGIYSLLATVAGRVGGLGLHLLVVPGIVGFAGGLVAMVKPEPDGDSIAAGMPAGYAG